MGPFSRSSALGALGPSPGVRTTRPVSGHPLSHSQPLFWTAAYFYGVLAILWRPFWMAGIVWYGVIFATVTAVTLVIAGVSFRVIEQPMIEFGGRLAERGQNRARA